MKKLILAAVLVVGMTAFAQSKGQRAHQVSPEQKIEKLTKELDLTQEQQAKLKVLFEQKQEKVNAKRSEMKQNREKQVAEKEDLDEQIRGILTDKQLEKYEARKAERMEMRKENRKDAMKVREENKTKRMEKIQK